MKKGLFLLFFSLICGVHSYSQDDGTTFDIHNGFQASVFAGPGFGHITGKTADFGELVFRGTRMNGLFQVGYAYRNWAGGLSFGLTSFNVESMVYQDTAYATSLSSMDNIIFGIYGKRYFMPINMFITFDAGISKFDLYDNEYALVGNTQRGFYWDVMVGKEFILGKRKRFGLGPYIGVNGLSCHDLEPFQNDKYSYVSFNAGAVFSFH